MSGDNPPPRAEYAPRWRNSRSPTPEELAAEFTVLPLDDENCLVRVPHFLPPDVLEHARTADVPRERGKAAFGHLKPRYELCYSVDGKPYVYGGRTQPTVTYPAHVLEQVHLILGVLRQHFPDTPYTRLSYGVDIQYDARLPRGGSVGEHSDDEQPWGAVAIVSLGQRRWMRFRHKEKRDRPHRDLCHLPLDDNSLLIMHGPTFQERYTHELPKLPAGVIPCVRKSLNIRFGAE